MIIKKSASIREQIYAKLKELIFNGELNPGERLVETDFAEKFCVSRTPLREAIRMLELEGLLEENPNGGVCVKKIRPDEIQEVYEIRIALEGIILKEIVENLDDTQLIPLEENLNKTKKLISDSQNSNEIIKLFTEFNNILYDLSKYSKVVSLIKNINMYLKLFRKFSVENNERRIIAFNEHLDLVKALKDKELKKALKINEQHLLEAKDFFLKSCENLC